MIDYKYYLVYNGYEFVVYQYNDYDQNRIIIAFNSNLELLLKETYSTMGEKFSINLIPFDFNK